MQEYYNFKTIEKKWQSIWNTNNTFSVKKDQKKKKYYILEMFPYPSGNLHMGHMRVYCIGDVLAHYYRMRGFNVLHPMGYDAFGLPAENAAIQSNIHPSEWTYNNIAHVRKQLKSMGISYDWNREITTCNEDYYKWTQYLFLKFYERGLVYKKMDIVNWCPSCQTVLANEQVENYLCWRCETEVTSEKIESWFFKITDYAEELLEAGHKELADEWPGRILSMQKNWIGKSTGVEINFILEPGTRGAGGGEKIPVFTTRQDTIFGATYIVLAPEHQLINRFIKNNPKIKSDLEKMISRKTKIDTDVEKEGIFTGFYAINPVNNEKIPIWISGYVLMEYGTGAIMAVPAHDQRDFEFAKKYNLPMRIVILAPSENTDVLKLKEAYDGEGILVNSGKFNGLRSSEALEKIALWMIETKIGRKKINYRLKDWSISRQRFWGEPIPIIYCDKCGIVPVPYKDLPVRLPEMKEFKVVKSPLALVSEFVNTKCPECGKEAKREVDTMDCFVASSWYFARYISPDCNYLPFDKSDADYWLPVDQYIGGPEHACKHLIYARFFTMVMRDLELLNINEPFKRLLTQGIVYKEGAKMSKSKGNVVSPDEIIEKYGADTGRLFILFAAPPETDLEWKDQGVEGAFRFLNRVWRLFEKHKEILSIGNCNNGDSPNFSERKMGLSPLLLPPEILDLRRITHKTIKNVTFDIEKEFHFNTAISSLMEFVNFLYSFEGTVPIFLKEKLDCPHPKYFKDSIETLILLLAPFTPHIASEMWEILGHKNSIFSESWPVYDENIIKEEEVFIIIQINGKLRSKIKVAATCLSEQEIKEKCLADEKIKKILEGKSIKKIVFVPNKLINIVILEKVNKWE